MSVDDFLDMLPQLWDGLQVTLSLWLLSGVVGLALAVPVAIARVSGGRVSRRLSHAFITVVRGTPLLLQIYIVCFGFGAVLARFPVVRQSFLWPFLRDA